jgi:hypothetical protein
MPNTNTTMTSPGTSESPLLALPAELRNDIVRLAVQEFETMVFTFEPNWDFGDSSSKNPVRMLGPLQPGITQTCRQLRHESLPVFYDVNDILVDLTQSPNDGSRGEWWLELERYKPDPETLMRVQLRFDVEFHDQDVEGASLENLPRKPLEVDIVMSTGTTSESARVKITAEECFRDRMCTCDLNGLAEKVVAKAGKASVETGGKGLGNPVVVACRLMEELYIRNLAFSRQHHEHCEDCGFAKVTKMEQLREWIDEYLAELADAAASVNDGTVTGGRTFFQRFLRWIGWSK